MWSGYAGSARPPSAGGSASPSRVALPAAFSLEIPATVLGAVAVALAQAGGLITSTQPDEAGAALTLGGTLRPGPSSRSSPR